MSDDFRWGEPGEKYRPSNGTEGEIFFDGWCRRCARDKSMRDGDPVDECDDNELCPIIALTYSEDVSSEKYPHEWTFDGDGWPICTAFVPAGDPIPRPRCDRTADLFEDGARETE